MVFVIGFTALLHSRRASTEQRKGVTFLGWESLEADVCALTCGSLVPRAPWETVLSSKPLWKLRLNHVEGDVFLSERLSSSSHTGFLSALGQRALYLLKCSLGNWAFFKEMVVTQVMASVHP